MIRKIFISIFLITLTCTKAFSNEKLFVIVNINNKIENISNEKLVQILLKNKQRWDDGNRKIHVILPNGKTFPRILKSIIKMTSLEWEEYWGKRSLFEGTRSPRIIKSQLRIIRKVTKDSRAIGIISSDIINEKRLSKLLRIVSKISL